MIEDPGGNTQQEWDEEATEKCNCKEAQDERWKKAVLEEFAENMKRLGVSKEIRGFLESGAALVADGVLGYVQVRTDTEAVVKITKKASGIFLRKTMTNTEELLSEGMYR